MSLAVDLRQKSIAVIESNQLSSGGLVACPTFDNYKYSWLRDGTFIAYAMDRVGRHDVAERFYRWVSRAVSRYEDRVEALIAKSRAGITIEHDEHLHTRYKLDGSEGQEGWPNFQLDGYGAWLWGLSEHARSTGKLHLLEEFRPAINVTIRYLLEFWPVPNHDCWEEFGDRVHPSTLACIYGGLRAIDDHFQDGGIAEATEQIQRRILTEGVADGHLIKSLGSREVDANLLWVSTPFRVLNPDHPLMIRTVEEIERRLLTGGVHRYPQDTYYGGGEWILLTGFLGWYYCEIGRFEQARALLAWIEAQADAEGLLPEQVPSNLNAPNYYPVWVERWGQIAKPLLWSHAMYLILLEEVRQAVAADGGAKIG